MLLTDGTIFQLVSRNYCGLNNQIVLSFHSLIMHLLHLHYQTQDNQNWSYVLVNNKRELIYFVVDKIKDIIGRWKDYNTFKALIEMWIENWQIVTIWNYQLSLIDWIYKLEYIPVDTYSIEIIIWSISKIYKWYVSYTEPV